MTGGWVGSTRRDELPDDWPERRAYVLDRDGHRCRWFEAGRYCGKWANQVDHITPGNNHRHENLQALCADHHAIKSSREGNAARWSERARRPAEQHPGMI